MFSLKIEWVCFVFFFVEDNIDGKVNGLKKAATKKGNRKTLNDITKQIIKHSYRNEKECTKKKEELSNVAQEMF